MTRRSGKVSRLAVGAADEDRDEAAPTETPTVPFRSTAPSRLAASVGDESRDQTATLTPAARRLADVLAEEREAVRRADVEALVVLQPLKRVALDALHDDNCDDETLEALGVLARDNITLMEHLVGCLRGIVATDGANVYGINGSVVQSVPPSRRHGAA